MSYVIDPPPEWWDRHDWKPFDPTSGLFARRDVATSFPEPVEELVHKIEKLADDWTNGVSMLYLEAHFKDIAKEAHKVVSMTSTPVSKEEMLSFAGDVAGKIMTFLIDHHMDDSKTLAFGIQLLVDIVEKINDAPNEMFVAVRVIEEVASTLGKVLEGIRGVFHGITNIGKRQTTIGGHVENGPWGTSGGISGSHTSGGTTIGGHVDHGPWGTSGGISGSHTTSGGTTFGGHVDHGPSGTSGGISASHTWGHSDGSKTSLGGFVDHSPHGGTSGGLSVTHNFGKRLAEALLEKREGSVGAHVNTGPGGTSGGVHASHTWHHSGGSKTTVGGHVDHSSHGGTSGGISVTHSFGKRLEMQ